MPWLLMSKSGEASTVSKYYVTRTSIFLGFCPTGMTAFQTGGCVFEVQKLITARLLAVLTSDVTRGEGSSIHLFTYDRQPDRDK